MSQPFVSGRLCHLIPTDLDRPGLPGHCFDTRSAKG
jgi:hypothetical protein